MLFCFSFSIWYAFSILNAGARCLKFKSTTPKTRTVKYRCAYR